MVTIVCCVASMGAKKKIKQRHRQASQMPAGIEEFYAGIYIYIYIESINQLIN